MDSVSHQNFIYSEYFVNNPKPIAVFEYKLDPDGTKSFTLQKYNSKFFETFLLDNSKYTIINLSDLYIDENEYQLNEILEKFANGEGFNFNAVCKTNNEKFYADCFFDKTLCYVSLEKQNIRFLSELDKYKSLLDNSPTPLLLHKNFKALYSNKAFKDMFRFPEDKNLRGFPLLEYIDQSFHKISIERLKNVMELNVVSEPMEFKLKRFNGEDLFAILSTSRVIYEDDNALLSSFNDITLKKSKEIENIESVVHFKEMAENLSDIIWKIDFDMNVIYISPSVYQILGYHQNEITEFNLNKIMPLESREVIEELIKREYEKIIKKDTKRKEFVRTEVQNIRKNGEVIWVEVVATFVTDEKGNPSYIYGISRDINEQKKAEFNLLNKESKYRSILTNTPAINYRCAYDEFWTMEYIGDEIERIWGYKAEEFIKNKVRSFSSIIFDDDSSDIAKKINLSVTSGKPFSFEYRIKDAFGKTRWVLEKGRAITGKNKMIEWLDGVLFDITERKGIEDRLRFNELQLKKLVEQIQFASEGSNTANWEVLPKKNKIYVNKIWATQKGFIPDEILSKSELFYEIKEGYKGWEKLIHPDDFKGVQENFDKCFSGKTEKYQYEYRIKHKDGKYYWVQDIGKVFEKNEKGEVLRMNGIQLDINQRKINENKLQLYAKELSETNETQNKLFQVIAHDLKSPSLSIMGFAELLKTDFKEMSEEENFEIITMMYNASKNHTKQLIDLLEWSKSIIRGREIVLKEFYLSVVIKDVLEYLKENISIKGIKIESIIDKNDLIKFDEQIIRIILRNLLSNAIKFSKRGRKIIVQTEVENNFVHLSVEDFGIGISEEYKNNLLDNNFNEIKRGTEGEKGSGLGLSLIKNYLNNFNGKLDIKSEQGKGSKFIVTLPI